MIFNSFKDNPNVIVSRDEVHDGKKLRDESFDDCRLRSLWELMDFIGLVKGGHGNYLNQTKQLKYYRPVPKPTEQQELLLD